VSLYDVNASMQIDAKQIEAMPLTITLTMSVQAWRRLQALIKDGPHHTTNSAVDWSIRESLRHIDEATAKTLRFKNGNEQRDPS
jgi:hypothetical protein